MSVYLVPPGIGDAAWALMVTQSIAEKSADRSIDIRIGSWGSSSMDARALEFMRRFAFVRSAEMYRMPASPGQSGPWVEPGPQADEQGINRYIPTGKAATYPGIDWVLVPNRHLEEGKRLETWLPGERVNWTFMDDFLFSHREIRDADAVAKNVGSFAVFFMASLAGNTTAGHNRGPLWTPDEWVRLGAELHERGLAIVVVGAEWDRDYFDAMIRPRVAGLAWWHDRIGSWPIGMTYAVIRRSRMVAAYQSGIGIVAHYLGIPTVIWWRRKRPGHPEDSISPSSYVAHDEKMASAWARPDAVESGDLLPAIYGRTTVEDIITHAGKFQWLEAGRA